MVDVNADLFVAEGAGERQLNVDDLKTAATGAATQTTLAAVLAELVQKLEPSDLAALATAAKQDTLIGRLPSALDGDALAVSDVFTGDEYLTDQTGDGTVKTFTFTSAVDLIIVRSIAVVARATCDGTAPTNSKGIYCAIDEPTYITRRTSTVKVLAASGTLAVWGFRG